MLFAPATRRLEPAVRFLDGCPEEIGEFDFQFPEIVHDRIVHKRLERRVPFRHIPFGDGMTRVDFPHVDAGIVPDLTFGEKEKRIEAECIDVEREQVRFLHELDGFESQRLAKPSENRRTDALRTSEHASGIVVAEADRRRKSGNFQFPSARKVV